MFSGADMPRALQWTRTHSPQLQPNFFIGYKSSTGLHRRAPVCSTAVRTLIVGCLQCVVLPYALSLLTRQSRVFRGRHAACQWARTHSGVSGLAVLDTSGTLLTGDHSLQRPQTPNIDCTDTPATATPTELKPISIPNCCPIFCLLK